jgi:hypothetical protein
MRKILGYISEEDRKRYGRSYARAVAAMNGAGNLSLDEAADVIVEDQELFAELRRKYEIEPDEAVDFSLYDGAIVEDKE